MPIGIVIQARMSSQRLPAKVLANLCGKPLLAYLVERARRSRTAAHLLLATSLDPADDPLEEFCSRHGVPCYRGDLHNVAQRFLQAVEPRGWEGFVRLSGDSPLLDPALIDQAVDLYQASAADLVTNVWPRTFPPGQSVEVVRSETFRRIYARMRQPDDYEHVTRFFYKSAGDFRIVNFAAPRDLSRHGLSVDTADDMNRMKRLIARMERPHWEYGLNEVVALLESEPLARDKACSG